MFLPPPPSLPPLSPSFVFARVAACVMCGSMSLRKTAVGESKMRAKTPQTTQLTTKTKTAHTHNTHAHTQIQTAHLVWIPSLEVSVALPHCIWRDFGLAYLTALQPRRANTRSAELQTKQQDLPFSRCVTHTVIPTRRCHSQSEQGFGSRAARQSGPRPTWLEPFSLARLLGRFKETQRERKKKREREREEEKGTRN